jgi:hypothetical protein
MVIGRSDQDPADRGADDAAAAERLRAVRRQSAQQDRALRKWERAQRSQRRRQRFRPLLTIVVVVAVVVGGTAWIKHRRAQTGGAAPGVALFGDGDAASSAVRIAGGQPTAGVDASPTPLGAPVVAPVGEGGYRFVDIQAGAKPVAWDPCRAVHVAVNPAGAPPIGDELIRRAVADVAAATGLTFVFDVPSDERPSADRAPYQPARYGDRWAPLLITWSDGTETPKLSGVVAGVGGGERLELPRGSVIVTGAVTLDRVDATAELEAVGGPDDLQGVVEHELGHAVGLDHVDDPTQLMNPRLTPGVVTYGDGDRRGLSLLGQGACFPEI